ncbi:MAG: GNAT family N-acetyltransferase [Candidatus Aminicenantes bacterium]|nr:GNAT family N-acetyltransferase [Candidatus Aminicenantes bacterium]
MNKEQDAHANLLIRPFGEDDYHAVISLWEQTGIPCKPQGRDSKEKILKELSNPGTLFLVAEKDGDIIGTVMATHDGRKGWINRLSVVPRRQHQGIATRLLKEAEDHLYRCGMEIITCLIEDDNPGSMEFFRKKEYIKHTDIIYFSKRKYPDV